MFNLPVKNLKQLHDHFENYKGKRLVVLLLVTFSAFLVVGLVAGNAINYLLKKDEIPTKKSTQVENPINAEYSYEGRVVFIDPHFYPDDNISYFLEDQDKNEIILLSSKDQKLVVAEGHFVVVFGKKMKTKDLEKDVLLVDRVVIKNVSN